MDRITITVRENGSFFITGDDMARVRLVDHQGNEISTEGRKALSLCRCGGSATKPFCDGTHSRIGFRGANAAREAFDAGASEQQAAAVAAATVSSPTPQAPPAPAPTVNPELPAVPGHHPGEG
jgi:3-phenylpropionate/trans-cinnamate dioxygenase ferredoxin subunit